MEEKRRKFSFSSDDSDTTDSHTTSWSRCSKVPANKITWPRQTEKKPSEVFRTDLITAMKIPDSYQFGPDDFYILADPWRQEWEKGVQVPASSEAAPQPEVRFSRVFEDSPLLMSDCSLSGTECPGGFHTTAQATCRYDLDEIDTCWLELVNLEFKEMDMPLLDELTFEKVLEELEMVCFENMNIAIETEEGLGIEYDEDVVCDVCRSPEGEDGNEMVFCDKCNVCVHQACYGILKVPTGSWLCRSCALGAQAKCLLCPKRGGALKPTRSGTKWVHVSCALWIPEVSIGCPEKMEPITKISHIPPSRWALSCSLCKECTGTCIQCSKPSCITAFHVTCAFDRHLEMHTTLVENDEVKFKSFCLEHSSSSTKTESQRPSLSDKEADQTKLDLEKVTLRKHKLMQLEENFYELVKPEDVAENLYVNQNLVDFVFQYWKLKRKANFNKPLLTPKTDEVDNLAQQEQDVLYRRLNLFTHLRQDLERVRNLCYMVTKREKMKHSICKLEEQIFHLQMKLIEKDLHNEKSKKKTKGKKTDPKRKGRDSRKSSPEKKDEMKTGNGSVLGQLGLSTSFPIDGTFFSSWLAQSVQITTENMAMSQWSLNNGHHEDDTPGLLSEELLQDEKALLSLMVDNSLKSPFKQNETVKKVRSKTKMNGKKKKLPKNSQCSVLKGDHEELVHWENLKYFSDESEKPLNQNSKANKIGKGLSKVHICRKVQGEKKTSKKTLHTRTEKADGSHRLAERNPAGSEKKTLKYSQPECNSPVKVPDSLGCATTTMRLRLSKDGVKSKDVHCENKEMANEPQVSEAPKLKSHLDNETDGYYSDAEMTDSEEDSTQRRVHLNKFDSSNDDIVRMSILAS